MLKLFLLIFFVLLFSACNNNKPTKKLDAKKLIETKCATCHNLNMPPVVTNDELAPPMMAVSFHVHNFVKPSDESQRTSKAIAFVVDYIHNPSFEKSFCDKDSLKRYGLMPSQKENVTTDEAKAIASYMFDYFTQANLSKIQKEKAKYNAMSPAKKIAISYRCLGCHDTNKKKVGPSFIDIASKYKNSKKELISSIKNGSKENWKSSNGAIMPPFKQISDKDLNLLSEWILKSNS